MNRLINFFKLKKTSLFNFWVNNGLALLGIALIGNHLTEQENFPFSEDYSFPWIHMLISLAIGSIIMGIAYFNFQQYKAKYFTTKINTSVLLRYLLSTLGYVAIAYILFYLAVAWMVEGKEGISLYGLFVGLSVTLLISAIGISISFSKEVYNLHKSTVVSGTLKVQQGGKITPVKHTEIAYLYSAQKVVYLVKTDSSIITTDFTLNDIETEMSELDCFRANRQTILHPRAVAQVTAIENAKLAVQLKPVLSEAAISQITISRYKKQAFKEWLNSNL